MRRWPAPGNMLLLHHQYVWWLAMNGTQAREKVCFILFIYNSSTLLNSVLRFKHSYHTTKIHSWLTLLGGAQEKGFRSPPTCRPNLRVCHHPAWRVQQQEANLLFKRSTPICAQQWGKLLVTKLRKLSSLAIPPTCCVTRVFLSLVSLAGR